MGRGNLNSQTLPVLYPSGRSGPQWLEGSSPQPAAVCAKSGRGAADSMGTSHLVCISNTLVSDEKTRGNAWKQ